MLQMAIESHFCLVHRTLWSGYSECIFFEYHVPTLHMYCQNILYTYIYKILLNPLERLLNATYLFLNINQELIEYGFNDELYDNVRIINQKIF